MNWRRVTSIIRENKIMFQNAPFAIFAVYFGAINIASAGLFWFDKFQAKNRGWRFVSASDLGFQKSSFNYRLFLEDGLAECGLWSGLNIRRLSRNLRFHIM